MICTLEPNSEGGHRPFCSIARSMGEGWVDARHRSTFSEYKRRASCNPKGRLMPTMPNAVALPVLTITA